MKKICNDDKEQRKDDSKKNVVKTPASPSKPNHFFLTCKQQAIAKGFGFDNNPDNEDPGCGIA